MDKPKKNRVGTGFARLVSIILLLAMAVGILILSEIIVKKWDPAATVNTRLVMPWYLLSILIIFSFFDCFNFAGRRYHALVYSCIFSTALACIIVLILPYVLVGENVSKKIMLLNGVLMCLGLLVWLKVSRDLFFYFRPPSRTLLVTDGSKEMWLKDKINSSNRIFTVDGSVSPSDPDIYQIIAGYDAVVIGSISAEEKKNIIGMCASLRKHVLVRPEYTDIMMINAQTEQFDDLMMIRTGAFGLSAAQRAVKRAFDIVFAAIGLVVMLPVIAICAFAVFAEDGHNPFYTQERLTYRKRTYRVIKLRTMVPNAEQMSGPMLAEEDDPRITRVGRVLRKLRLDEWPQVINILKGDMSIVGPRPEREYFYKKIKAVIPEFKHRLSVKAGLTGMAQVYGRYSTDPYEKLMLDLMYIQNYSIILDIKLVIETVRVIFEKDAAKGTQAQEHDVKKWNDDAHAEDKR